MRLLFLIAGAILISYASIDASARIPRSAAAKRDFQRVRALLELLNVCPPEHPLSAGLFVGLVESVGERMANVVDGLRAARGATVAL